MTSKTIEQVWTEQFNEPPPSIPSFDPQTYTLRYESLGAIAPINCIKLWTIETDDYYDERRIIVQRRVDRNIKLNFGPLSTTLKDLVADGFEIIVPIDIGGPFHPLYIQNRQRRLKYKLTKVRHNRIYDEPDMMTHCRNSEYSPAPCTIRVHNHIVPQDPFEELMRRYPKPINEVKMIGNQTILQYVKQQLQGDYDGRKVPA